MADTNNNMATPEPEGMPFAIPDISGIPTTPVAPPGGFPAANGYPDISGVPTTPVAPPGSAPVPSGPNYPVFPDFGWPIFPSTPVTYYGQVRFLNATTSGTLIDVFIDNRIVLSGSSFATFNPYVRVSDGFHTVTVRQSSGQMQILYQQPQAFVSGERMTMVILDSPGGVTIARVSDMGCTNLPAGYGCCRVANMSYNGSNYDIRLSNNQTVFSNVGFREVTSFKQAAAGNYTFFVTNAQMSVNAIREVPIILVSNIATSGCINCGVNNPILTYSINVQAGRAYTSYIIGNPWTNLYRVLTLSDD